MKKDGSLKAQIQDFRLDFYEDPSTKKDQEGIEDSSDDKDVTIKAHKEEEREDSQPVN